MKALPHKFESTSNITDLAMVVGYQQCLSDIFNWMKEKEKVGYIIDRTLLDECIIETTNELKEMHNLTNEIKSLIKPQP